MLNNYTLAVLKFSWYNSRLQIAEGQITKAQLYKQIVHINMLTYMYWCLVATTNRIQDTYL